MKSLLDLVLVLSGVITGDRRLLTLGTKTINSTYPGAVDSATDAGAVFGQTSEPFYPSPWMNPNTGGWEDAYAKAKDFVSQLTLLEKVNITTGVG